MMMTVSGHIFEYSQDLIEVSSLHRPDTNWRYVDGQGHVHQWYSNGEVAATYSPTSTYSPDSLKWVKDGEEYWEDSDEPHEVGHFECPQCGEHVSPRYRADDTIHYIGGLKHYRIDGEPVTPDVFKMRYEAATVAAHQHTK